MNKRELKVSPEAKERARYNNATIWDDPASMLDSQYGRITYKAWCLKEKDRFLTHGIATAVITVGDTVALCRL